MNRRINRKAIVSIALGALVLAASILSGCAAPGETIRDRLDAFVSAVNLQNAQGIKDSLDPTAVQYNLQNLTFWNTFFLVRPTSITSFSTSGNTATATFTGGVTYSFEMTENSATSMFEGKKYKIKKVSAGGVAFFQ